LQADYWIVSGVTMTNAQNGVMIDGGNHSVVRDLEIRDVGYGGVLIFVFSSDNLVEKSWIHHTWMLIASNDATIIGNTASCSVRDGAEVVGYVTSAGSGFATIPCTP
jgi:hypothetical protein